MDLIGKILSFMREYNLSEEDVSAALEYASDLIETEQFHPLPKY